MITLTDPSCYKPGFSRTRQSMLYCLSLRCYSCCSQLNCFCEKNSNECYKFYNSATSWSLGSHRMPFALTSTMLSKLQFSFTLPLIFKKSPRPNINIFKSSTTEWFHVPLYCIFLTPTPTNKDNNTCMFMTNLKQIIKTIICLHSKENCNSVIEYWLKNCVWLAVSSHLCSTGKKIW